MAGGESRVEIGRRETVGCREMVECRVLGDGNPDGWIDWDVGDWGGRVWHRVCGGDREYGEGVGR